MQIYLSEEQDCSCSKEMMWHALNSFFFLICNALSMPVLGPITRSLPPPLTKKESPSSSVEPHHHHSQHQYQHQHHHHDHQQNQVMDICPKLRTFKLFVTASLPDLGDTLSTLGHCLDQVFLSNIIWTMMAIAMMMNLTVV